MDDAANDDLLEAYRRLREDKKRRAVAEAQSKKIAEGDAEVPKPRPERAPREAPEPVQWAKPEAAPREVASEPIDEEVEPETETEPPAETAPVPKAKPKPAAPAAPQHAPTEEPAHEAKWSPAEVEEDHDEAPAPNTLPRHLTVADKNLGLAPKVLQDPLVFEGGLQPLVKIGAWMVAIGAALGVIAGLLYVRVGHVTFLGIPLWLLASAIAIAGALSMVILKFIPQQKAVRLKFSETQFEEWNLARRNYRAVRMTRWILYTLAVLLVASSTILAFLQPDLLSIWIHILVVGAAAISGVAGYVLGLITPMLRKLYVQSLILAHLEERGIGGAGSTAGPDPAHLAVIRSLDKLLASLPDQKIREFMASPDSKQFLEVMNSLEGNK